MKYFSSCHKTVSHWLHISFVSSVRAYPSSVYVYPFHQLTVNQEAPFDVPENDPGSEWPEHGVVTFDNYQVARISGELRGRKNFSNFFMDNPVSHRPIKKTIVQLSFRKLGTLQSLAFGHFFQLNAGFCLYGIP